jgi:hypothetical protein
MLKNKVLILKNKIKPTNLMRKRNRPRGSNRRGDIICVATFMGIEDTI